MFSKNANNAAKTSEEKNKINLKYKGGMFNWLLIIKFNNVH